MIFSLFGFCKLRQKIMDLFLEKHMLSHTNISPTILCTKLSMFLYMYEIFVSMISLRCFWCHMSNTYMYINDTVDFHWLLLPRKIWIKTWLFCIQKKKKEKRNL